MTEIKIVLPNWLLGLLASYLILAVTFKTWRWSKSNKGKKEE